MCAPSPCVYDMMSKPVLWKWKTLRHEFSPSHDNWLLNTPCPLQCLPDDLQLVWRCSAMKTHVTMLLINSSSDVTSWDSLESLFCYQFLPLLHYCSALQYILKRCGEEGASVVFERSQLIWFSELIRMPPMSPLEVFRAHPTGRRSQGRSSDLGSTRRSWNNVWNTLVSLLQA